ncbi:MAG: TerD family protein, partial [Muribaculaceae bacterium]|nr:TerD family protein [Muribaculaceae bacterium]
MAINLTKGQRIDLGLKKVRIVLGWKPNIGTRFDFDLDASAFMLGSDGQIPAER